MIDNVVFGLKMKGVFVYECCCEVVELFEFVGFGGFGVYYFL